MISISYGICTTDTYISSYITMDNKKRKHATIYAYRGAAARELSGGDVLQTVVAQRDALHRRPELYLEEGVAQPGEELSGRLLVEAEREHGRPRLPPARLGDRLVRVRLRLRLRLRLRVRVNPDGVRGRVRVRVRTTLKVSTICSAVT